MPLRSGHSPMQNPSKVPHCPQDEVQIPYLGLQTLLDPALVYLSKFCLSHLLPLTITTHPLLSSSADHPLVLYAILSPCLQHFVPSSPCSYPMLSFNVDFMIHVCTDTCKNEHIAWCEGQD